MKFNKFQTFKKDFMHALKHNLVYIHKVPTNVMYSNYITININSLLPTHCNI